MWWDRNVRYIKQYINPIYMPIQFFVLCSCLNAAISFDQMVVNQSTVLCISFVHCNNVINISYSEKGSDWITDVYGIKICLSVFNVVIMFPCFLIYNRLCWKYYLFFLLWLIKKYQQWDDPIWLIRKDSTATKLILSHHFSFCFVFFLHFSLSLFVCIVMKNTKNCGGKLAETSNSCSHSSSSSSNSRAAAKHTVHAVCERWCPADCDAEGWGCECRAHYFQCAE